MMEDFERKTVLSNKGWNMTLGNLDSADCIIDHSDLLTRCMGNQQFAARILDAFQRQLDADLDELEAAIRAGDSHLVAVIAHRVKGASSNVSARQLNRLATSIGEWAKNRQIENLQSCRQQIREAQQDFIESAEQFAALTGSSPRPSNPMV
jgi:HPt (histidine-containing phosphotransfer) domain-containing protein